MTFLVGPDKTKFIVHKNQLVLQSTHFQRVLSSGFQEEAEGIITLEDDDPAALKIIIEFLYTGQVPNFLKKQSPTADFGTDWKDAEYRREVLSYQLLLLKVCVLAEVWTWAVSLNFSYHSILLNEMHDDYNLKNNH